MHELVNIEAVIFDFGGVLCFHPGEDRYAAIAKTIHADPAKFTEAFWKHRVPYDAGLDAEEYWSTVVDDLGKTWDPSLLPSLIEQEIALWDQLDERMIEFAAFIQSRGYGTAILSNCPKALGERLRATPGFMNPFDHHTFSIELGVVKPDCAIYQHAIDGLGIAPQQALLLDDREENVEGARDAGLEAEVYSCWEDLSEIIAPRYGLPLPEVARRQ